jgi:hypothetical protein
VATSGPAKELADAISTLLRQPLGRQELVPQAIGWDRRVNVGIERSQRPRANAVGRAKEAPGFIGRVRCQDNDLGEAANLAGPALDMLDVSREVAAT